MSRLLCCLKSPTSAPCFLLVTSLSSAVLWVIVEHFRAVSIKSLRCQFLAHHEQFLFLSDVSGNSCCVPHFSDAKPEKRRVLSRLNMVHKMPPVGVISVQLFGSVCLSHSPLRWYVIHFQSPRLKQRISVAWDLLLFPPSVDMYSLWMPAICKSKIGGLVAQPCVYPDVLRSSWTPWKRSSSLPISMVGMGSPLSPYQLV